MNNSLKPKYKSAPITSEKSLSNALGGFDLRIIDKIIQNTSRCYTTFTQKTGKNRKERKIHAPKTKLKILQKSINKNIFGNVLYPEYLTGSISGKDYVINASMHCGNSTIISLDIKDFYPSIRKQDVEKIFCYLFKYNRLISEKLYKLVTVNDKVPQGSCCSSHIANLIFFNSEHILVNKLQLQGFTYTRLLDDITISSPKNLSKEEVGLVIDDVCKMLKKYGLNLNVSKTKIEHKSNSKADLKVTGLLAKQKIPKIPREERKSIKFLVFSCQKAAESGLTEKNYHVLWNQAMGKVSQVIRLHPSEGKKLLARLSSIAPQYSGEKIYSIKKRVDHFLKMNPNPLDSRDVHKFHQLVHHANIISRTNKALASNIKARLNHVFKAPNVFP